MKLLEKIDYWAKNTPFSIAYRYKEESINYRELNESSNSIAGWIAKHKGNDKSPVVVLGHMQPEMITVFLGCVKAGYSYIPIDLSVPLARIKAIMEDSGAKLVFLLENTNLLSEIKDMNVSIVDSTKYYEILKGNYNDIRYGMEDSDDFYIIYTSGSTGIPKGVRISYRSLNYFVNWGIESFDIKDNSSFLNHAPFSFDLSVMSLYVALFTGGRVLSIDKDTFLNPRLMYYSLEKEKVKYWISTPSFVEMFIGDKRFNSDMLPSVKSFIFCGEVLGMETVQYLFLNFYQASVFNSYGPTETTVATSYFRLERDSSINGASVPIGSIKTLKTIDSPDIYIINEKFEKVKDGEKGEIIVVGQNVGSGYFNDVIKTNLSFFEFDGKRAFRTRDLGVIKDNFLFYSGRIDNQVKVKGFRVEIEDIESNLKKIYGVQNAAVIPELGDNKITSLKAFITINKKELSHVDNINQYIFMKLSKLVPNYMVPEHITIIDELPKTVNHKVDRNKLIKYKGKGDLLC